MILSPFPGKMAGEVKGHGEGSCPADQVSEPRPGRVGAMIDLKAFAGKKYRVVLGEAAAHELEPLKSRSWHYEIPCKHGHVYVHGERKLGAYTSSPRMVTKLAALEGVAVHQRGDHEASVTFAPGRLDAVAGLLGARRRRVLSAEQRAKAARHLAEVRPETPAPGSRGAA